MRSFGSRKERNERLLLAGADRRISVIFFDFFKNFKGDYKMKSTYLIFEDFVNGNQTLRTATAEEWNAILQYNRTAPKEQRRYFIRDSFDDCGKLDCMFIEVTREKYEEWHREQSAKYRNRKSKAAYLHISLDAANLNGEADALKETLASEFNLEDYVVNQERMSALRSELREWRYWGTDMLDVFLQGQNRQSMKEFTEKYGVSNVTVAKWKKLFRAYMKEYLR